MRSRPTAGQASAEYVAALALVAVVFGFAAPAVGAPDIGRKVIHAIRLGICKVASDICTGDDARAAGVAPCPLRSDTTGEEASVTAFSIELGGRDTLTVTPRSDGSVGVMRTAGLSAGVTVGLGADLSVGPIAFDVGVSGGLAQRVQAARGWEFLDAASAKRFLEHPLRNAVDERRWPAAWRSSENTSEVGAMVGATAGAKGYDGLLIGVAASAQSTAGGRLTRDGILTLYTRTAIDGPAASVPFLPAVARGRDEWLVEYTLGPAGPIEIAFRRAVPGATGTRVTETVARLDLRDPANLAVARPLLDTRLPWPPTTKEPKHAVLRRIASHGVIERSVSELNDDSRGASGSIRGGLKFGLGARRIEIHKRLLESAARTRGSPERERFDCTA